MIIIYIEFNKKHKAILYTSAEHLILIIKLNL